MIKRAAFTLLELMLAVMIAFILLSLSLPSISGLVHDRARRQTFDTIDKLALQAQDLSLSERRAYELAWDKKGIVLRPAEPQTDEEDKGTRVLEFSEEESYALELPAALVPDPSLIWTFWPTGTCEPANIHYEGGIGKWVARYDPLTVRAEVEE